MQEHQPNRNDWDKLNKGDLINLSKSDQDELGDINAGEYSPEKGRLVEQAKKDEYLLEDKKAMGVFSNTILRLMEERDEKDKKRAELQKELNSMDVEKEGVTGEEYDKYNKLEKEIYSLGQEITQYYQKINEKLNESPSMQIAMEKYLKGKNAREDIYNPRNPRLN